MEKIGKSPKVLGLDISTKTIGWALFDIQKKNLLELTHFSPKTKEKLESKIEEMLVKTNQFQEKLKDYREVGITKVIIEEPLLNSNNIRTVSTLMRYNSFITRIIYETLGIVPEYISTYNSRKYAFPELFTENKKGRKVLFGNYDVGCDKKYIIWQKVSDVEPHLTWTYTRNNTLKKENFDMCDAYTCVLGYMKEKSIW
tara:strand:- start:84 stop:680 length:597 start_codon:yes stop_codon:yes gene_type:complete